MDEAYKIYVLKLVIDLIKVDNKIQKDEIKCIEQLLSQYHYTQEQLQEAHYVSLQEALTALQQLPVSQREEILDTLKRLVTIDNDIAPNERILLACIELALQEESHRKVQIITTYNNNFDNYDRQLIYLEQQSGSIAHIIAENELTIRHRLKSWDIDLFFLPHIRKVLSSPASHITSTISLLFPAYTNIDEAEKRHLLDRLTTGYFCNYLHKLMDKECEPFKFTHFFLLKIQSSNNALQYTTDFLCLDCSTHPVESIDMLTKSLSFDLPDEYIPYEGCYRTLFELISEESKHNHPLLLKGDTFFLRGTSNIPVEISGSERKTLYTLFLLHGTDGISNTQFATMSKASTLGKQAIAIYRYFANEKNNELLEKSLQDNQEPMVITNLRDIAKRNSHIGYIKRAFTGIRSLKEPQLYYPINIKGEHTYNIMLPTTMMHAQNISSCETESLAISFFK